MTGVLIILTLTMVIVACTALVVRRDAQRAGHDAIYLDSPTWPAARIAASDPGAQSPADSPAALPQGARLRGPASQRDESERLLDEVIQGLERIPPLPHVLLRILGELDSAGSTARSLAEIVATEPVVAASLLRIANSSASGLRRRIISLDEAVTYLGYSTVRALVMRMKLAELVPQRHALGYNSQDLWRHSLAVGQVAAHLARTTGGDDCWLVSTLGLLHDIGKLAINSQFPNEVARLWDPRYAGPGDESFLARERRLFGADHAFIGGFLAAQWKLPAELIDSIRLHHLPGNSAASLPPELRRATQLVHVANQLVKYEHVYCADMEIDIVSADLLAELKLPPNIERLLTADVRQLIHRTALLAGDGEPPAA